MLIESFVNLDGDLLVLGVGGKMGPTLARMAVRASQEAGTKRRVIGVARFSQPELPAWLQKHGIEPLGRDLLDPKQLAKLPDAPNVVVMTALKFGSSGRPGDTWAVNCWLPANICQRYAGSRIAAFSTGNVYPLTPISQRRLPRNRSRSCRSANMPPAASAANGSTTTSAALPARGCRSCG